MIPINKKPVTLQLDGCNVGRGIKWEETQAGIRREFEIITHSIDMWHVLEYEHELMPTASHGQFHDADTYVIRWHYSTLQTGSRTLRGEESRQSFVGRTRCAYFFWQGRHSSINEKGASALMTVELDEERGPQVRVVQGKEPPCFINLFRGRMVVHVGKRVEQHAASTTWRLYAVRNELPGESYIHEVTPVSQSCLRSRTSFLLLGTTTGVLFLWHGAKSSLDVVRRAQDITMQLLSSCPVEIGLHDDIDKLRVVEMIEGNECSAFWTAFDTTGRLPLYHSLLSDCHHFNFSPRLFHLSSVSGVFEATEIVNPAINHVGIPSAFPFHQSDLYNEIQPALFLVDNGHDVYLWQGWWPDQDSVKSDGLSPDSVRTGSTEARFLVNRKCAMQTTLQYCRAVNGKSPPTAYLVYAGLEPLVFTNIFPFWKVYETVERLSLADGKQAAKNGDCLELVTEALCKLNQQTVYSWEELQRRPLPDGVDALRLEIYLADDEFEEVVGMTREEFSGIPTWKQANIKKEVGLY
jgi:supervillin